MRNKNIIFNFLIVLIGVSISACDPDVEILGQDSAGNYTMVYMPQAEGGPKLFVLAIKDVPAELVLGAACGGVNSPSDDITVAIDVDPSLVEQYNLLKGTNYAALPDDAIYPEQ